MQFMNRMTDDKLVSAYIGGNNEAFDELLRRHQGKIFAYIYSVVKNRDIADDIFQETFVKAIVTLKQGRYSANGKFSAWVSRIAHNLIIDYYRQEKSEQTVSADQDDINLLNRKDLCAENVEDLIVNEQIQADVRKIIEALPESQREVLEMRYYKDMSFKEIAEATNVSINTALGRMRYAIINMRRIASENNIVLTN